MMDITDQEFQLMRELIYARFGISLSDKKKSLLVGRLQKHIGALGFYSVKEYYEHLIADRTEKALGELVDRISTNHTYFNREKSHFEFFSETVLPELTERLRRHDARDLRIWCAGCSTGEEPYTLLMLVHEFLGMEGDRWDTGLLATDISDRALAIARAGVYSDDRVQSLPAGLRNKYFRRLPSGDWAVLDKLKKDAIFRRFNLMNDRFPFKKQFQVIFCRNVMIYFDQPTRETLVRKFHQFLEPGGYFFIGHSETLGREQTLYKYILPAAYRKGER
ncbi:MAG: chemotaxis protein CheR [Deltaproteobacteria bacterium RIFOXYD12_FULL_57_12]|nr:MAG: chemotaxis protein CheR [Deltaproteobacteria bacterium RIFOXYD12_FULL_57_12]